MLASKDYFRLSSDEKKILKEYKQLTGHNSIEEFIEKSKDEDVRNQSIELVEKNPFILNVDSMFPNYYLNELELKKNRPFFKNKLSEFYTLLNKESSTTENNLLSFINTNNAYFIVGSLLKNRTDFGHHDRYIFQEFPLPPNYRADYLLVGKNSSGYHFCFIELENPYGNITLKDGSFGETIRKGLNQIEDWRIWNEKNFSSLKNVFLKYNTNNDNLPLEFLEYDNSRINYFIIAGRRKDFKLNKKTYRLAREKSKERIKVLHYDNLLDDARNLLKDCRY